MIQITPHMRIFAVNIPIDFRKGIDGLAAICRQIFNEDPFSGVLFLFRNRQKTSLKLLLYDGQGFWLCTKRLSKGKFKWWPESSDAKLTLTMQELQTLIWNGNPVGASFSDAWRKI
jgi:transposase